MHQYKYISMHVMMHCSKRLCEFNHFFLFAGLTGLYMFGVSCEVVQYLLERLPNIETCRKYKRKYEEDETNWIAKVAHHSFILDLIV